MKIVRRLFVVPLANDHHGKTSIVNALLAQGLGAPSPEKKGKRILTSVCGREIDAYIFVRSFQETEKKRTKNVAKALQINDAGWATRDLLIFPSHVSDGSKDVGQMIQLAHLAGFDTVCATVLRERDNRSALSDIWRKNWDERWTLPNPTQKDPRVLEAQLHALGSDLWTWICRRLTP